MNSVARAGRRAQRSIATLAMAGLLCAPAIGGERRLVAVGDIHGAYTDFRSILKAAELIDEDGHWSGGQAVLVQTGDFLDRGLQETRVMDLLMRLEKEADKAGGRVEVLLGNHEIMNLTFDLRYISAEGFAEFADGKSAGRREKAYGDYKRFVERRARRLDEEPPPFDEAHRQEWMERHPEGMLERMEAMKKGRYGRWLRKHGVVTRVNRTAFAHGGIHPDLAGLSPDDINKRVQDELEAYGRLREALVKRDLILPFFTLSETRDAVAAEMERLKARQDPETDAGERELLEAFQSAGGWFIQHSHGPVWFRGYARWVESEETTASLRRLTEAFDVDRFVVGHTPMLGKGIQSRFDGRIFLIDTGMLSWYYKGGRASALEFSGDRTTAIYLTGREQLQPAVVSATGSGF